MPRQDDNARLAKAIVAPYVSLIELACRISYLRVKALWLVFSFKFDCTATSGTEPGGEHSMPIERTIAMNTGTVKFFNANKGFGFIQPDTGGADVFVHISAVERAGLSTIVEGQKLTYDVVRDSRSGKSAADNLKAA